MSRFGHRRLRDAAYAATWAITPDKLDAVLEFLDLRAEGHTLSKADLQERGIKAAAARAGIVETSTAQQIAVLPLRGVIAHHAGMEMQISGGTSTVAFGQAFDAAMANPNVSAIVINADSSGGTVDGVPELFSKIFAARGQGKKITAVCNAHMHSAAYWICAAADSIVITPSGAIGDIGVMTVHTDTSALEEKAGVKRTLIKAGAHKGEGVPFEPLSDEDRASIQTRVNDCYALFVSDVARGRGDSVANVKSGYGEGRSVSAKQAVAIGLADRIATLEQVIAGLGGQSSTAKSRGGMTASTAIDELCPDCGTPMELQDGEYVCPECDGPPVTDASAELVRIAAVAANADTLIQAVVRAPLDAAVVLPLSTLAASAARTELIPITTTQESVMTPEEKAAEIKALRDAEKARTSAIRALCTDHGMTLKAEQYIADDLTIDAVRAAILDEKKTVTAATRVPINVTSVVQRSDKDPRKGFRNPQEFMAAVIGNRSRDFSQIKDERLKALAVRDGEDEEAGGDVAFMLPRAFSSPQMLATVGSDEQANYADTYGGFASNITTRAAGMLTVDFEGDPTAGRTQNVPMASTTVEFLARTDKNHTTSVTGGLTVARKAEAAAAAASRMATELVTMKATSLFALCYITEEQITDSPMSAAAIAEAGFRTQFGAHLLNEKLRGLGGSEYQGILNATDASGLGCTLSIAKETGQGADTIQTENVINMRAQCWGYGDAIWLANHDTYPQLATLSIGVGAAGALVYQQSVVEDRPDMLLGRPIFYTEFASTIGDVGDIILSNWTQYLEGLYQPLQSAESIHVRFVNHERAIKMWTRNAGQPWWRSALTPNKSTKKLSPFIVLAAR